MTTVSWYVRVLALAKKSRVCFDHSIFPAIFTMALVRVLVILLGTPHTTARNAVNALLTRPSCPIPSPNT